MRDGSRNAMRTRIDGSFLERHPRVAATTPSEMTTLLDEHGWEPCSPNFLE